MKEDTVFGRIRSWIQSRRKVRNLTLLDQNGVLYVQQYDRELSRIAAALAKELGITVRPRINQLQKCAELCTWRGVVIALVHVHGEMCAPNLIIVESRFSDEAKRIVDRFFSLPVEHKPFVQQ